MVKKYRIHPGIGIARVGNSDQNDHFIGPEVPDLRFLPAPDGKYRNAQGKVRRQGTRFRIYEHTYAQPGDSAPISVREITAAEADITWEVHLANSKSHNQNGNVIPNDPGARKVQGKDQHVEVPGAVFGKPVPLGTLLTDGAARLVVLGGFGRAGSDQEGRPVTSIRNPWWYDDTSDGPVRATITLKGTGEKPPVDPAWVIVGPPKFAAPTVPIVTLYDIAQNAMSPQQPQPLSFTTDIYPLLYRVSMMQWVSKSAREGFGPGKDDFLQPERFAKLKDPSPPHKAERVKVFATFEANKVPPPRTVTTYQMKILQSWSQGNFAADWPADRHPGNPPDVVPFASLSPLQQTQALDRAGLSAGLGGSFSPGMEAASVMASKNTYEESLRILRTLAPGTLTRQLAIPWQGDFNFPCTEYWWPAGRPGSVTQNGSDFYQWVPWPEQSGTNVEMVKDWWQLGFLRRDPAPPYAHRETERLLPIPTEEHEIPSEAEALKEMKQQGLLDDLPAETARQLGLA